MELPKEEATRLFDYASQLFVEERFIEALHVLDELMAYRNSSRRVLFARADCLHRLDRVDEAMHICDELIAYHDYEPAKKLRVKLENKQLANLYNDDPAPNSYALPDLDFDLPPTKIGPAPVFSAMTEEEKRVRLKHWLFIGFYILCILALCGGLSAFFHAQGIIEGATHSALFVFIGSQALSYTICLFAVFFLFKKFEKDHPLENAAHLFNTAAMLNVLCAFVMLAYAFVPPVIAEVAGLFCLNILLIMKLRFGLLQLISFFALLLILRGAFAFALIGPQIMATLGK